MVPSGRRKAVYWTRCPATSMTWFSGRPLAIMVDDRQQVPLDCGLYFARARPSRLRVEMSGRSDLHLVQILWSYLERCAQRQRLPSPADQISASGQNRGRCRGRWQYRPRTTSDPGDGRPNYQLLPLRPRESRRHRRGRSLPRLSDLCARTSSWPRALRTPDAAPARAPAAVVESPAPRAISAAMPPVAPAAPAMAITSRNILRSL
jgi:hypothetical protein